MSELEVGMTERKAIEYFNNVTIDTSIGEVIRDLMMQHNLDYANDVDEDEVMDFAKGLLKKVCNVIDTEQTAYDVDKVVAELKESSEKFTEYDVEIDDYVSQFAIGIHKAIEIVKQGVKE